MYIKDDMVGEEEERIKLIVCMQVMRGLHRKAVLFVSEPDTRVS